MVGADTIPWPSQSYIHKNLRQCSMKYIVHNEVAAQMNSWRARRHIQVVMEGFLCNRESLSRGDRSVLMLAIVINKRKKKIKQKRESDENRAEQILQVPMT